MFSFIKNDLVIELFFFTEIRSLDSEMQTLVYENYNKFISATDTIRKVKNALIIQPTLS